MYSSLVVWILIQTGELENEVRSIHTSAALYQ